MLDNSDKADPVSTFILSRENNEERQVLSQVMGREHADQLSKLLNPTVAWIDEDEVVIADGDTVLNRSEFHTISPTWSLVAQYCRENGLEMFTEAEYVRFQGKNNYKFEAFRPEEWSVKSPSNEMKARCIGTYLREGTAAYWDNGVQTIQGSSDKSYASVARLLFRVPREKHVSNEGTASADTLDPMITSVQAATAEGAQLAVLDFALGSPAQTTEIRVTRNTREASVSVNTDDGLGKNKGSGDQSGEYVLKYGEPQEIFIQKGGERVALGYKLTIERNGDVALFTENGDVTHILLPGLHLFGQRYNERGRDFDPLFLTEEGKPSIEPSTSSVIKIFRRGGQIIVESIVPNTPVQSPAGTETTEAAASISTTKRTRSTEGSAELSPELQSAFNLLMTGYDENLDKGLYTETSCPKAEVRAWLLEEPARLQWAANSAARGGRPLFTGEENGEFCLDECSPEVPKSPRDICYGPNAAEYAFGPEGRDRNALTQAERLGKGSTLISITRGELLERAGLVQNKNTWEWRPHADDRDLNLASMKDGKNKDYGRAWDAGCGVVARNCANGHSGGGGLRCSLRGKRP